MNNKQKNLVLSGVAVALMMVSFTARSDRAELDPSTVVVDMEAAKAVALAEVPGSVVEVELEQEDGKTVWEFEIVAADGERVELLVDATSGELISSEVESEKDGDQDDDDRDDENDGMS